MNTMISSGNVLIGLCAIMVIYGFWKIRVILSSFNTCDFDKNDMQKIYQQYKNDVRDFDDTDVAGSVLYQDSDYDFDESQLVFQEAPVDRRLLH